MQQKMALVVLISFVLTASVLTAAPQTSQWARPDLSGELPRDLLEPEGKSRWDLTSLSAGEGWIRTLEQEGTSVRVTDGSDELRSRLYVDPSGGDAAQRWLMPDRFDDLLLPGARQELILQEGEARLVIQMETLATGWVHLPSGRRKASLQRALVLMDGASGGGLLIHRWVDPRAGIVAQVSGPVSADGTVRLAVDDAILVDEAGTQAVGKIFVEELDDPPLTSLLYGWDSGPGTTVSSLTPDAHPTMAEMIAATNWDFSSNTTGVEVAATTAQVGASETCNTGNCGYVLGQSLLREDKDFDDPDPANRVFNNQVIERVTTAGDATVFLRAGSQNEGVSGIFGSGESKFCYVSGGRTEVPLWQFSHPEAGSFFFQNGDSWSSTTFNCEQNIFNGVCQSCGFLCPLFSAGTAFDADCQGPGGEPHQGNQRTEVLGEGVVTLPSGHTVDTLLVRTVADFCVYLFGTCGSPTDRVRTVVYLWQAPHLGTVAFLQSEQIAPLDLVSFSTVEETNIKHGLFPPESIAVTGETATSVDLSWDPGSSLKIDDFRIYWDTDSGDPYLFDSVTNSGQVTFNGNTATVSGLTAATTYFFTVTARSGYPKLCVGGLNDGERCAVDGDCSSGTCSGVGTTYESLLFPKQVLGDPGFAYPVEVKATTTGGACTPTESVCGITVDKVQGGIQICWNPVVDACLDVYDVLGAGSPQPASLSAIAQTANTCWTGDPGESFFRVRVRGTGGTGP